MEEMTVNAQYIMSSLLGKGWTKNAIAGILGNMQSESTINPGIWQSLDEGNMNMGFGLVQWTPASKYINWANGRKLPYREMDSNLARIQYEVDNNIQWINSLDPKGRTFKQFTKSSDSANDLAMVFIKAYERPADPNQPNRGTQAEHWFSTLSGDGSGGGGKPVFPTTAGLEITTHYGWRTHPITGEQDFHAAIDIGGGGVNHPIYATQDGTIIDNYLQDGGGWCIRIQHVGDPYLSQYLHLAEQSPITVGSSVTKGQEIATMGTTGNSTGIHLDFAIGKSNAGWFTEEGTIDPELYLNMDFGGGEGGGISVNKNITLINMLLSDSLNGWKW